MCVCDDCKILILISSVSNYDSMCFVALLRQPQGNEISVTLNQLWQYEAYSALVTSVAKPIPYNTNRKFSVMTVNLRFKRQSLGLSTTKAAYEYSFFIVSSSSGG
jgi:hypothetical protein